MSIKPVVWIKRRKPKAPGMNHDKGADGQTVKGQKLDPTEESADKQQFSPGTKMIRLDDFIPKQDVKAGRRVFFCGKSTENKTRK